MPAGKPTAGIRPRGTARLVVIVNPANLSAAIVLAVILALYLIVRHLR